MSRPANETPAFPDVVVSGLRATGHLHLGNYFGAIRQFVVAQDKYPCYFFIADYHTLTTHPNPENLAETTESLVAEYLACGIDPEKATLYVQSGVPEVTELYLFFNMNAYLGELERVASFKEKVRKQPDNINAGLLTYPVLMAADILIHKGTLVPVGKDQEQHLEMTRNFAARFNRIYRTTLFPLPRPLTPEGELIKIPGLDGSGKMGKSESPGNAIFLTDPPAVIRKKVMRAVTDSGPTEPDQPMSPGVANLFTLLKYFSSPDTYRHFEAAYRRCTIRYGDLKKQLAEDIIAMVAPIQEKITYYGAHRDLLRRIIRQGNEKARESARKTVREARSAIGLRDF